MNQKLWTVESERAPKTDNGRTSRLEKVMKFFMLKALGQATGGYLILKEQGETISKFGKHGASVQAEINVLDSRFYTRALMNGSSGLGEAFVNGWWKTPDITRVIRFFSLNLAVLDAVTGRFGWLTRPLQRLRRFSRTNTQAQAKHNILAHYDLGNGLYSTFLDERMQYSSAIYHAGTDSLAQAQVNKMQRLCEQLKLKEQDHLLEIGSGWGGLAIFAASNYGCQVTTTTISDKQYHYAKAAIAEAGLQDRIKLLNQDYRALTGQYDKIVSVEMVEAVGQAFLPEFFRKTDALLKPGGLLMLQSITIADQRYRHYSSGEDFIQKHIFPGGFLPSVSALTHIIATRTDFIVRDIFDIGLDYAATLNAWRTNLLAHRAKLSADGYDERFMRLWLFYFGYCEAGFLERRISTIQLLASKAPHHPIRSNNPDDA